MQRRRTIAAALSAALAGVTFGTIGAAGAQNEPEVATSPGAGAPGSKIGVHGSGFAGQCDVLLYWQSADGTVVGRAPINQGGTFSTSVTVPADAGAGKAAIAARGRSFGSSGCGEESGTAASTAFSVTGARTEPGSINLKTRVLKAAGINAATVAKAKASKSGTHAIVQLRRQPSAGDLDALAELGIEPLAFLSAKDGPGSAYLAALKPTLDDGHATFAKLVRAVHPMIGADKVEYGLAVKVARGSAAVASVILFFDDVAPADAAAALSAHGVAARRDGRSSTYLAALTKAQVQALAGEDGVQFLAAAPEPGQLDLDNSRALINVDEVQKFNVPSATYLGLSGLGVQLSIHDSGVDQHHNDFDGRMLNTLHPVDGGDHGTHVAGIAAGSGAMSDQRNVNGTGTNNGGTAFQWRGMAPQAQIAAFGSQTLNSAAIMDDAINNLGVDVSNHSYSYNDGQYDADMVNIDTIIRGDSPGIPARPAVISAGNQGTGPQYGMNSGYFSLSKGCKNCIMVANLQANGVLNGGSSHGPAPDGRLKPDIGADGSSVISTGADVDDEDDPPPAVQGDATEDSYRTKSGTSMSTPAVTGSVALLLQQYADQFGVDLDTAPPLPSTVKAWLIQTAVDQAGTASGTNPDTGAGTVYGAGPDWGTGYGSIDVEAASALLADELFLEDSLSTSDVTDEHLVSVVPGQAELRVTIAWDDLPGTPNADDSAPTLVNDLDLMLVGPNGEVGLPLVMPAAAQSDCDNGTSGIQTGTCTPGADPGPFNTVAAPGIDRLNNVEQVVLANPAPGLWKARVSVLNTNGTTRLPLGGSQSYSIAGVTDARADLRVTKSDSPDPATAGEQLFYTVSVHNEGPETALGAVVVDTLPAGVSYVTNDLPGGCVQAPVGTLTCSVGDIPAGQTKSFTIKVHIDPALVANNNGPRSIFNTVTASSNTVDDDLSDNTDVEGTIVEDKADLEVTKVCKPDGPLPAGETGTCTIFVDNLGPSFARAVVLRDTNLSDGAFTFGTITTSQGTCGAPANGVVTCQLGTLPIASASSTGRATVTVNVSASEEVDINDVADVTSPTPDPDASNNQAQESINVTAVSDLSVDKTGPATAVAGTDVVYNLTIANNGPSTAQGVVIQDVVSAGVQILSVNGSGGATCNAGVPGNADLPTTCSFGTLAPSATRTMTLTVKVLPGTLGVIHNDARVTSPTFDDDLSNNLDTVATTVTGEADLSITKSDSPDPVTAGTQLTYTLTVDNAGPSTAQDVTITDTIPAGTSFVSGVDGNGATVCTLVQTGTVVCDLGAMAPGATRIVYLTVLVAPSVPPGSISNTATVSSATTDPNGANNSDTEGTNVDAKADLWIDKQATQRSGNPSPVLIYTLVVHNDAGCETDAQSTVSPNCGNGGPSDAKNITVTDRLPLDSKKLVVQYVSPQCTYNKATHTVTCTSPTVKAGTSVTFVIEAQVSGSVGTILNSADVASTTTDPDLTNNRNDASIVMKGGTGKKGR